MTQVKDFEKVFKQLYFDKYHKKDLKFNYDTITNTTKTIDRITIENSKKRIIQIIIEKNKIVWKTSEGFQNFIKRTCWNWAFYLVKDSNF